MNSDAQPYVFCVGLNKTGTTSFHSAMRLLGFKSLHWGGQETRDLVANALEKGLPLLTYLDQDYRAFSDIEILAKNFELLDAQYPDSKFVLTVRPLDAWLESRRKHVENNIKKKEEGKYDGNFVKVEFEKWSWLYNTHHKKVREYFAGRGDYVELDITAGDGWEPLCSLMDIAVPDAPFPHSNPSSNFGS